MLRRRGGPALLVSPAPVDPEMKRAMPTFLQFDARPWLASIQTPALVLCGSADPIVPVAQSRAMHEALPKSTLAVIEGGGHVPTSQGNPEVAQAFARFIDSLGRA